jgi:hypothetical protein
MKKWKIYALLFLSVGVSGSYGQSEVPVRVPELVKEISPGIEPGQLGYRRLSTGGGDIFPSKPLFLGNEVYILDNLNWRINVYSLDFSLLRSIKLTGFQATYLQAWISTDNLVPKV